MKQVELQSEHRRALESIVVHAGARDSRLGIAAGVVVSLSCLAVAAYAVHEKSPGVAIAIVTTTLVSLVGVFVSGSRSSKQERDQKAAENPAPGAHPSPSTPTNPSAPAA